MTDNGIVCQLDELEVHLDPKKSSQTGVNFVSHAHSDHLPKHNGGIILSSKETLEIASLRGNNLHNPVHQMENFSLIDSGHILGSKGLLIDEIFYTGDICTRPRGFLDGAQVPKCEILITECTFGLPEFEFPSLSQIVKQVNGIISDLYSKGIPVILMGYQLGKSQTISQLFKHWSPMYYHDSVKLMNDLHREFGVELNLGMGHTEAESKGLLKKTPWVMVAPMMNERNPFVRKMKANYGAITIGFSGWAKSSKFSFGRGTDFSIPLSDHCDFFELIEMVKKTEARKVYTIHGFVNEFAQTLNKIGIEAQPLKKDTLDDFFN